MTFEQADLFVSHRERYIAAYRRLQQWERTASERLRQTILVRYFGGCGCRMHNCLMNYESGRNESPITVNGRTYTHREQAKLARKYNREQAMIWAQYNRLSAAFAKHL